MSRLELPPKGAYMLVPFGAKAQQVCLVVDHTRTGRVKIRAFNASRNEWMSGTRTVDAEVLTPAGQRGVGLPWPGPLKLRS